MRHCLRSFLVLALPLSILTACGTDTESGSPVETALDLTGVASFCADAEILADIEAIFPTSQRLRHVATVNCGQIFSDDSKDKETEAIEKAFAFFLKTLEQNEADLLLDPAPSTEARIVELFTAIFEGIGFDIPEIDPEVLMDGEYAIGTLIPGGPPLITGSLHAGIGDPDGTGLFGPVTAFIVMIEAEESEIILSSVEHPCPTGIEGNEDVGDFDCYPLFYDYSVSPESNVTPVGLQLGQCNVSPEGVEVELLTPEGFLTLDDAPTGLDCTDVEPEVTMTGWRSYAWTVLEPVAPLLRVTPAFAGQSPIGGRISNFSPVAPADPNSGLTETSTELLPDNADMSVGFGEGDTETFSASVTDLETEFGVSEGTVTFTVTGVEFLLTFVADVVEGSAFMDVGCGLDSSYGDLRVPPGEFTVEADYSGTENYAVSSDPDASTLSCQEIVG